MKVNIEKMKMKKGHNMVIGDKVVVEGTITEIRTSENGSFFVVKPFPEQNEKYIKGLYNFMVPDFCVWDKTEYGHAIIDEVAR